MKCFHETVAQLIGPVFNQTIGSFFFLTMHCENFVVNYILAPKFLYCPFVIKELVHAFSCAYIELWMHLGSLQSTQGVKGALSCASSNSYISLVLSMT